MYGATNNKSSALVQLETWYTDNLASYEAYIDTNAGFCGDRTSYTDKSGTTTGTGTGPHYFGDYVRLVTNKAPVLTCANTNDLYTVTGAIKGNKLLTSPIGLINANEVAMAGGVYGTTNKSYYLYNGQHYWTMSPSDVNSSNYAFVFDIFSLQPGTYYLSSGNVSMGLGLRPVINLRVDVPITGSGTQNDPFVVN